ncbi:MAG: hypothetical protein A2268_13610 [Candidatus Raymondbacteria bacterium RifOxyA12_full_50_37]|uniref:PKD domain-containing protein n=1 Tax=Candidatus Raymondbacteria bacterium RIFOXYD12_FULL_49_13 TaxID=1817890 RepID=A0A1F7F8Y8_UNCRA|nr:MAG: hypothetical protein A2268_13610 [Candidatus Raymondbacteria bacterium RifOxyA12_full_50_37]OGJ91494.1 MAG: hypothetical protein A2248_03585 [Candidatus Raymondbacteria bacterium RIFOXYA2_FULL_49_16]OGJ97808.1 MAG: hypothetical protein A2453_13970 [Candidatus Raymondbacteria bacterium RIFOXYC2_FULL_50_21]OGJ99440.1 MAG: hypothetical protein A2350_08800 [Candidatus Raymondbacteria bacterium RifOxyB12_full_50_8]OGK02997.1 MAG: hypothetical protein A2519_06540 [Candidatus Raymondbacteria b
MRRVHTYPVRKNSRPYLSIIVFGIISILAVGNSPADERIYAVRFSPNGQFVAAVGGDGSAKFWDWQTGKYFSSIPTFGWAHDISWSPDGRRVTIGIRGPAREYDFLSGALLHTFNKASMWEVAIEYMHNDLARCAIAGPVIGTTTGHLDVWGVGTGSILRNIVDNNGGGEALDLSPDDSIGALGCWDSILGYSKVKLWDLSTGNVIRTLSPIYTNWCTCVKYTPDGKKLVSTSNDGTAKLWDVLTGNLLLTFTGHTQNVRECAVSPDGKRLLTACQDGRVGYWNLETGANIYMMNHGGVIDGVDFSPDGSVGVSCSYSVTIKLWDLSTGSMIRQFSGTTTAPSNYWPTAFAGADIKGVVNQTVNFDGSASADLDNDPLTYTWDFGDGSPQGVGAIVSHAYSSAGPYKVVLTVSDGLSLDTDILTAIIDNPTGIISSSDIPGNPVLDAGPNPLNATATISLFNPGKSARLLIYDIRGNLVKEFKNIRAGKNTVVWNIGTHASGVYVIKAKIGNDNYLKKLILSR